MVKSKTIIKRLDPDGVPIRSTVILRPNCGQRLMGDMTKSPGFGSTINRIELRTYSIR